MVFKRIPRWLGRQFGKLLEGFGRLSYRITARAVYLGGLLLVLIIGIALTFLGNLVLLFLGALITLLIALLKLLAVASEKLILGTKWFGEHVIEFQKNFFQGITDVFKQEEEFLNREISVLVKSEKS